MIFEMFFFYHLDLLLYDVNVIFLLLFIFQVVFYGLHFFLYDANVSFLCACANNEAAGRRLLAARADPRLVSKIINRPVTQHQAVTVCPSLSAWPSFCLRVS